MILPILLFFACAHRGPGARSGGVDPEQPPILAAPEADLYAAVGGEPRDALVAAAAQGMSWDEALSGAAGSLALASDRAPELGQARWAAWRAGYPYPLRALSFAAEEPGAFPDELISAVKAEIRPGDHLGLARARVGQEDRWVALIGRASRTLSPFPRQLARGETLRLEGAGVARFRLTSPTGQAQEGPLPAAPALAETGEWWLELYAEDERVVLAVPVTVGMAPSPAPPLDLPGRAPDGPEQATAQALEGIAEIRAIFDLAPVGADPTLALLARQPLEAREGWTVAEAPGRVRAAGFAQGDGFSCSAPTVPLCLDAALRSGDGRRALLDPRWRLAGGGARVESSGVSLVFFLATE